MVGLEEVISFCRSPGERGGNEDSLDVEGVGFEVLDGGGGKRSC